MQLWALLLCAALTVAMGRAAEPQTVQVDQLSDAAPGVSSSHNVNKIVDILLDLTQGEVAARSLDTVPLPDFVQEFRKDRTRFFKVKGKFEAYNGWAKSLTLERKGDAIVNISNHGVKIDVPLTFHKLKIGYLYRAKFGVKLSGQLNATVGSSELRLRASLSVLDTSCHAAVDSLELTDLGKIKVKTTGLGPLNFIIGKVGESISKNCHDKVQKAVQNELRKAIDNASLKFNCDKLWKLVGGIFRHI